MEDIFKPDFQIATSGEQPCKSLKETAQSRHKVYLSQTVTWNYNEIRPWGIRLRAIVDESHVQ